MLSMKRMNPIVFGSQKTRLLANIENIDYSFIPYVKGDTSTQPFRLLLIIIGWINFHNNLLNRAEFSLR